jgi:hypothetical protein
MTEFSDVDSRVTADHLLGEKSSIIDARSGQQHQWELAPSTPSNRGDAEWTTTLSTKPWLTSEYWSIGVRQHRIDIAAALSRVSRSECATTAPGRTGTAITTHPLEAFTSTKESHL